MKIPFEMRIKLDDHQNKILNMNEILSYIEIVDDKYLLEYYIKEICNEPILKKEMIKKILEKANERLNYLNNVNSLYDLLQVAKEKTDKLSNITIVDTTKEMNDKINGYSKDVTYIKLNDSNEIYEVLNVDKVKQFLNNKEMLEEMSEYEIMSFLRDNSKKIETKQIDTRESDELSSDQIKKEIESINDPYLKEMFLKEQNSILKERVEINEYVKTNMPETNIEYGINSNGERIYTVGDKIIKFEGKERNMQILDNNEIEKNQIGTSNFSQYKQGEESDMDFFEKKYASIYDYDGKEELLDTIIEAIFNNIGITRKQIKFLTDFFDKCVINEEMGYTNPGNLQEIFDKYYEYSKTSSKVLNDEIRAIFDRKEALLNKTDKEEYEKDYDIEHTKILRFVPNKKDDINGIDGLGFISVTLLLEATLVGTLIIALLTLVK